MPTYVWNCEQCGEIEVYRSIGEYNVPPDHEHPVVRVISAVFGFGDIKPYVATAGDMAGKPIGSRNAHRAYLKRNKLVEFGDVKPPPKPEPFRKVVDRKSVNRSIIRAIHEVNQKHPR
jgi:hypothetical protein